MGGFAGDLCQQELSRNEGSRLGGPRAKWKGHTVTTKASANPGDSSGAGMAFQVYSRWRQMGQAFMLLLSRSLVGVIPEEVA